MLPETRFMQTTLSEYAAAFLTVAAVSATSVLVSGDFDSDGRDELRVACKDCQAVVADFDVT